MTSRKDLKRKLNAPDLLQKWFADTLRWFSDNQQVVIATLGTVLLVFVGVIAYQYYQESEADKRQSALSKIDLEFQREEESAEKQRTQLRTGLSKTEPGKKSDPKTEAADKAIEEKVLAIEADHTKSMEEYGKFYLANSATPEGWVAGIRFARDLAERNKAAEAISTFEKIAAQSAAGKSQTHESLARYSLASLYAEASRFEDALISTDKALGIVPKDAKPDILLLKAQIQLASQDKEGASKTLDLLLTEHDSSSEAPLARALKATL